MRAVGIGERIERFPGWNQLIYMVIF